MYCIVPCDRPLLNQARYPHDYNLPCREMDVDLAAEAAHACSTLDEAVTFCFNQDSRSEIASALGMSLGDLSRQAQRESLSLLAGGFAPPSQPPARTMRVEDSWHEVRDSSACCECYRKHY